ncbi:ATP-binding protein [Actinoplanes sp. NPDC049548]|uniref:ATP-binding protein n=1 Tax=Actinoplanes sp. NPDC049548 TaxID=3155152 RepID=UPI0034208AD9
MREKPPYLFDPGDEHFRVTADADGAVIDMTVRGTWQPALHSAASRTLRMCLAESPAGIVVDLTAIEDPAAASVPTWLGAARATAAATPAAGLALCLPPGASLAAHLDRAGAPAIHATAAEARAALAEHRAHEVIRMSLPPASLSPSRARDLVGRVCQDWKLPALLHPARAVISELVTNAVEHARTQIDVAVSRRGAALHLAVRDRDPMLPRILDLPPVRTGHPLDERGRGLRVVHADSTAWGAMPTAGGKVVWATVRDRAGRPRPW